MLLAKKYSVKLCVLLTSLFFINQIHSQVIISQYYEGTGTNKWIELTNLGNTSVNTASPQLQLGLWASAGSTGNISFSGSPSSTVALSVTIPAKGSVLIGNTGNGTEVPYLTAASAAQSSNTVINFNGNDGIALLNASGTIIDRFGTGINATDISYVRNATVTAQSSTFVLSQWTTASLTTVQTAAAGTSNRLGVHTPPACVTPTAQPTALSFGTITSSSIAGSFTGTTAADEYLVVRSLTSTLSANPVDGTVYNAGNALGGGTVVSRGASSSFSSTGLNAGTIYYHFVFSIKSTSCTGGPKYLTTTPLTGSATTLLPACVTPAAQPTALAFSGVTSTSINGSFTAAVANEYLVVRSLSSSLSANPVDGTVYNAGNALGGGTVVQRSTATSFSATGLSVGTTYFFFVYSINSAGCSGGPKYRTTAPLTGSQATAANACVAPTAQPTALNFSSVTQTSMNGSFTASAADEFLVVRSLNSSLSANPVDGTVYSAGNALGGGTVIQRSNATSFSSTGLTASTTYYYFVFALNSNCSGGPVYLSAAPLSGSQATAANSTTLNYYFGNLHSHSSSSDGNKEDLTKGPADNYAFAKTALCMDFLGISEHNHTGAGMHLVDWQPGRNAAAAATTSTFVGLYGMEWGVISGGGHVIVYGMDSLIGWEPNEYQIYVPKSVYTGAGGLFEKINNHGNNALAYLAHPNTSDFNNLAGTAYNAAADNAIVGSTVESGPAFSTTTNYTNPASMTDVGYYRTMLGKGYHLGPTIDHDNHYMTFGKTAKTRLVILAPALSENNLLQSMREMKFYASEDCGAAIDFRVNNQPVGSIFTGIGAPVITVGSTTTSPVTSLTLFYGVPGSGVAATSVATSTTGTLAFTHTALANLATGYYYCDITEADGTRILTSPIWYTRNDAGNGPHSITSLFTINEDNRVVVKWTTRNEEAAQQFVIERSLDGGHTFEPIGLTNGNGATPFTNTYVLNDDAPSTGLSLYRLVQKNSDGKTAFTDVKAVNRTGAEFTYMSVYPNPVHGLLAVKLNAPAAQKTTIEIFDISGRRLLTQNIAIVEGDQTLSVNMGALQSGSYIIKTVIGGRVMMKQVVKM